MMKKKTNQETISETTHKLNEVLMRSIERLDDDDLMKKNGYAEVERSNAISKASQTMVNILKTNIKIKELADKQNKTMTEIREELDR